MLFQLMLECRNFFHYACERGRFVIEGGSAEVLGAYHAGQYVLVTGSMYNDGVKRVESFVNGSLTLEDAADESFTGMIYALRVPPDFIALAAEIEEFNSSPSGKPSAYSSESVTGVHSYNRAAKGGVPLGWRDVFAARLEPYRRMFSGVTF